MNFFIFPVISIQNVMAFFNTLAAIPVKNDELLSVDRTQDALQIP